MVSVCAAAPVLPLSLIDTVSRTLLVLSRAVWYCTLEAAMKALISLKVPDSVSVAVPESPTVTPLPETALRVPLGTEKVTVTEPLPASKSLKLMPVTPPGTSSVTVSDTGTVATGASFTGVTARVTVLVSVPTLSLSTVMVRVTSAVALAAVV